MFLFLPNLTLSAAEINKSSISFPKDAHSDNFCSVFDFDVSALVEVSSSVSFISKTSNPISS